MFDTEGQYKFNFPGELEFCSDGPWGLRAKSFTRIKKIVKISRVFSHYWDENSKMIEKKLAYC